MLSKKNRNNRHSKIAAILSKNLERRLLFLDNMAAILERQLFLLFLDNITTILKRRLLFLDNMAAILERRLLLQSSF
jgi:hypothetical protein